ncbi:TrmH family RNA methyltransferase [Patulibacter defluvii]|uniref:TrmH family RNA methyltransferase n=1 Tax=Patulibacter defluvii TaxID=3095358 RepID=UPI002A753759|nr:TrmH family RNA methyltransferase [Patulibacter sp. DM4]
MDLRELQHDHRLRDERGLAVVDDEALLLAALEAGCTIELLLEDAARREDPAPWRQLVDPAVAIPAAGDALRELSATGRRPRAVAAVRRPPVPPGPAPGGGLALLGVSDSGNVGGILRTAAAFRLPAVTLLDGCADPWGRKALRVSQGAAFRPGLVRRATDVASLREHSEGPLVAAVAHDGEDPRALPAGATVLLGAGHGGLTRGDVARCDLTVTVPADGFDSLGVSAAAAVVAYALAGARETTAGRRPAADVARA